MIFLDIFIDGTLRVKTSELKMEKGNDVILD